MLNNAKKNGKTEGIKYADFLKANEKDKHLAYEKSKEASKKKDSSAKLD